jgi:hypothetical protein
MNTIATFFFFYLPRLIIYRRRHFFELFPFVSLFRTILAQFTEGQMSRYESFRRSALQKTNMKRVCFPIACIFLLFSYYIFFFFLSRPWNLFFGGTWWSFIPPCLLWVDTCKMNIFLCCGEQVARNPLGLYSSCYIC